MHATQHPDSDSAGESPHGPPGRWRALLARLWWPQHPLLPAPPARAPERPASGADRHGQLAAIVESSIDAIISKDLDGRITSWNAAAEQLFGYRAGEIIGTAVDCIVPAELQEEEARILRCIRRGESVRPFETVRRRKDGSLVPVSIALSPVRDATGRIIGASKVARDIGERRSAELALRESQRRLEESELRYRTLVRATASITWTCPPSGLQVEPQPEWMAFTGQSAEEMLGSGWTRAVHPQDVAQATARWNEAIASGEPYRNEHRIRRHDGEWRWMSVQAVPVRNVSGEILSMIGMNTDITERKHTEERLRESEQRYRATFDNAAVGIAHVALDGQWLLFNDAVCRITGYAPEALRQLSFSDITHPDDLEADWARARDLIAGRIDHYALEKRYYRPDGSIVWVILTVSILRDEHQAPLHFITVMEDISERRRSEEALRSADRQKDEFLAMLAHELRNPLAAIGNVGEILAQLRTAEPRIEHSVAMLRRQTRQLTRLVDDLLDTARIARGLIKLKREPLEVNAIAQQAAESVQALVREKRQLLSLHRSAGPVFVRGDPQRLVQALGNILHNATKYTPCGGEIQLEVRADGEEVTVAVTDTGMGITAELLPSVFDLFVQSERGLDRAQGGLGIGLAVVKRLIEMQGGAVSAASPGRGKGSTFLVRLPRIRGTEEAVSAPAPGGARPARRVLVVDDNADAADSLRLLLELEGHEVQTAYGAREALEVLESHAPDFVLLDIGLPELDGYEVARRMRARQGARPLRIIAVTGYGKSEDRQRAAEAGFDEHLLKPVDMHALGEILAGPVQERRRSPRRRTDQAG